ncbi:MAG: type II toxin-antitoxin system PemK/MazF family toxin [bacterium]|nr:type II toxin-antitoxin system PemK/MazF family toxin [bacterium]
MAYIPQQGDIIYLDFDPQSGHEQKGRRPAMVISNNAFNALSRGALVCPITNTNRGIPLHVQLDTRTKTTGVIMCDQVKALDMQSRNAAFIEKAPEDLVAEAVDIVIAMVEIL